MDVNWWAVTAEGLIAGAVVILGVVVAAAIDRSRSRRRSVEVAYQELVNPMHRVITGLVDPEIDTALGTPWRVEYDHAYSRLLEIQLQARNIRNATEIRYHAQDLMAHMVIATQLTSGGWRFESIIATEMPLQGLGHAIYGERPAWEPERLDSLQEHLRALISLDKRRT